MLEMPVRRKLNIHVIGSGGTGGYAIGYLARLLADGGHVIHVYDGDTVELKNLKRQNFTVQDLGMNKAEALCRHIQETVMHAPEMVPHPSFIGDGEDLLVEIAASLESDQSLVIILAVDNIATRKTVNSLIMESLVREKILTVAIDSGNHDQGGQVVLYGNGTVRHRELYLTESGMLPTMLQVYPELNTIEDENPAFVADCAENAESHPQAMLCNVRNGELIAHIVTRLLETGKSPGNLWRSDILTGNTTCSFTGFYGGDAG